MTKLSSLTRLAALALAVAAPVTVSAQSAGQTVGPTASKSPVIATVNGRTLTESDLKLAEAEIGGDLGNLPPATRRRVLLEYLIENQLFAEAAEGEKLAQRGGFDQRMEYWRRRALRDSYFDITVKDGISDAEKKAFYDQQLSGQGEGEQIRARHILVDTELKAKEIFEKIGHGGDFKLLAREHSKDPGSKEDGGDLGFFGKGQMVPQFEDAAFKLKVGEVSLPVQSQFGWHLIKLEDRREVKAPPFDAVKERITAALMHKKAQDIAMGLRDKAIIDYVDAEIKSQIEAEKTRAKAPAVVPLPAPGGASGVKK